MNSRMPRTIVPLLITVLALLASACGGSTDDTAQTDQGTTSPTSDDSSAATGDYNDADIVFLQGMIPHHEGAIEMAELVPDRTDRQELNELADEIIATQQPEIDQMEAMLAEAGADASPGGMDGMDDMAMGGMMSQEQMSSLEEAETAAFDLMFIDMMIGHHQGAIDAANEVIETGSNPQVDELADDVIAAQQAEIDQMTEWREAWADSSA